MVPVSTMDNGKAAWDTCSTDHGSLPLVHAAKHFMVGTNHGWYPHVYGMGMVLTDLCFCSMPWTPGLYPCDVPEEA
jgi:hypothetical protein